MRIEPPRPSGPPVLPATLIIESIVLGLALLLGAALSAPPFGSFRLGLDAIAISAVALAPLVLLALWSLRTDVRFFVELRDLVFDHVAPRFAGSSTLAILTISLAAGICEEALFRGVVQTGLVELIGPAAGLLIASALFGLLHPVSVTYMVLAGLVGAYLGGLLMLTGNVFVPMAVHAAHDFIALNLLVRGARAAAVTPTGASRTDPPQ